MAMELEDRLARERCGAREVQGKTGVDALAGGVAKWPVRGRARFGQAPEHAARDALYVVAGNADDADTAGAGGCCRCDDRVRAHVTRSFCRPFAPWLPPRRRG